MQTTPLSDITGARVLAMLGDSITTDHISPAGSIKKDSPAGSYLMDARRRADGLQLLRRAPRQSRSDDARHVRQRPAAQPDGAGHRGRLDDASARRRRDDDLRRGDEIQETPGVPLLSCIAGKEYGSGSSRDWAAKGTLLLGVKAVIAESFERIHRSNLVNMGVLPLQFEAAATAATPQVWTGQRALRADRHRTEPQAGRHSSPFARFGDGEQDRSSSRRLARIDTPEELVAFRHGGILPYVLRQLGWPGAERPGQGLYARCGARGFSRAYGALTVMTRSSRDQSSRRAGWGSTLCGIAPAAARGLVYFREWLDRGYAATMTYLHRSGADRRADVRHVVLRRRSA